MPTIDEMLAQYANTPIESAPIQGTSDTVGLSVSQQTMLKQAEVSAAAKRKREVLSGKSISEQEAYRLGITKSTGYGADSAPALSKALLNESLDSLVATDGPTAALRLLNQQISGQVGYNIDKNMPSSPMDNIGDTGLNVLSGGVNAIGGIGAWAGSLINDKLGTTLSGSLDSFNKVVEPLASDRSQSSRAIARITNELDTRDNEAQYQEDKTKGNVLAKLKREGRNAIGAIDIAASDPTMLLEGTAKGIGSMAAFGYVNKAVQGIGGAGKVATMIRDASMPISGGLVGGGSIYQQTTSEIMAKSPEEMAKISPQYNAYVDQGMSPKDAQIRVAAEAGEYAASIAAPLGAATTMMAPGLEKLPVKVGSVKGAIKSTLFEPKQEGVESFNEQLATNLGKQRVFDPKQDLAEGVGKSVGEGALYGLTSAGVTQAPGVAALGAKALKDGTSSFVGSMKEKIGALGEDNKNSSPVSDAALAATATTVATQVPAVAATMQAAVKDDPAMQEKVTNFTAIMQSVSTHDAADFDSASDSIKKALTGAVTKIDELTALKSVFNNKDSTDADRDFAGTKLVEELSAVNEFLNTQTDVIDAVQDEPTKKFVRDLKQLAANILSNKEFLATRNDVATRLAEKHKTSQPELAINADPTSQEGKQAIAETLAIASTLPTEVNGKAVEAILKHSEGGSIKLTQDQKDNLEISKAAIAALQDDLVEGTELMRVSTEAANAYEAGSKGKSAIQHATDIVRTISEGNISLAKTLLTSFQRFAQHYQNKAEAVNQATQEGNDQDYKAEYRQLAYGQWLKEKALYTFQKSGRGVELATQVHKEARAIGSMYNAIAAMYPDLQLDQVTLTEPDPIFLPNGKFDHKVTQHGIGGNGVAGITAYRNRLSIQQSKGAKNGQGQKEKVLTTPPTEVGSGSTQQPTTVSPIGQEAVVTKGSKAPLTRLFGDVLSNAILNIIDSVNKEAVKNKTLDFDVFLVKFVKDISSIPSTGFDALNKVREQQSNVFESGEFEWTKKEQKFGDVYYYPKKQTKEGIEIEKYVYKTSTYEITRSGPTDTIIFNSPIKFGEFEVKTIYASPGSFKLVSEDYAQQYINNELYVYGKELDIKIGGTNKRNSMVTYRRKSGVRSNGLYATFYENYYKIDPKYRSKNSFPLVFDEKGNNSYSEIVTTNPQTPEARPTNQGAPNGQGQKEKVLIAPVAPVTPTTPPIKALANMSIKRAQATVQSWKRRYGVKAKVDVIFDTALKSRGQVYFDEVSGKYIISLNPDRMDNLLLSTTLAHEFGHVLMLEQFDNASDQVKREILAAYRKDVELFSKNGSKKTFADRFANPGSRKIQEGAIGQNTGDAGIDYANRRDIGYEATGAAPSRYSPDQGYATSFEEWFANQFAKYIVQEVVGENITQRERSFWKTAIKKVKDFFEQVVLQVKPDAVFSSWVKSITKTKVSKVATVTPEKIGKQPSSVTPVVTALTPEPTNKMMEIRSELRTASTNPVAPKAEAKKPGFILRLLAKIASGIDSTKPVEFVANPEQQEGIDKIKAFLKAPISKQNGNGIFVLEGKAGTGKTSLVQKAIEDHLKAGGKVHIAAVSHKAKGLLEHKLNQFITKNRYNRATVIAKSVAGLLGMVPLGRDGFGFKHGTMPGTAPLLSSDLVIIDEASMIDAKLKNLIESNRPSGTRIIYLGDVGQLAPVGSSNISPVFTQNLPENNKHTLSTRVRQGEDSSILPYADYYWDNSVNAVPVARPVPISERSNTQELQFINEKDIDTEVISVFDRAMKEGNNSLIKIIVYNNKAGEAQNADEINKLEARIREALFGKDNSDIAEYENGEFVIMNETFALSEQESVENSREFVVESAEKRTDTVVVNGREMSLDVFELSVVDKFSKENFVLPVIAKLGPISARKALAFSRALKAWGNEVYALPYGPTKNNRIAEYNAVKNMYADVGYSYALTSHKAQGSTYDISVVLEDNFNEGFRDNHADRSRAIYTALTRASKMAIVVSRINTEDIVNSVEPTKTNTEVPTSPPVPPSTPAPPSGPTKVVLKAVSPYHAKDQAKSDKATKFIGSGAPNSSTESYRASWGKLANSGVYTAEDVVFVSSNGNRPGRKLPYYTELSKAIAAGATILTDSKKDRDRTYNIGEREVAEYLLLNKYEELSDGVWTPKAVTTPAVNPISAEELNELNTFLAAKKRLTEIITNPSGYAPEVIVAAKKELTDLTKERAKQVDYLFDGFPDELVELDFLSNVAPSLIANTAGKLERLWELRNKLGKLFADLGVSKLLSTAGNILIAGTKPVSKERVSQFIDRPFDTFVQIVNEKKDLKDNEKELRAALAEHITLRANLLKLGVERIVLDKVNSDNNLIKLLQLNHLDSLGNSSKHRVDLFPENRLFSLLAPVGKGDTPEVRLDPYLMETASLAFMQWMLSAADRKAVVDEKTVANILGIDENVVTEAQIAEYSERITNIEAIDAISAGIMRHWSLKPKDNIQVGYSEGVARVLAKEMLDVAVSKEVIEAGFGLNHNQVRVDLTKTVDSYGVDKLPKTIKLANAIFPDLIDNTAFIENEQAMYIGENVTVPVSKTILREPNQLLTPEQIRAQDNNQKTIHRIDESSYKLFMGIGAKGVFDILSLPEETDSLNVGHAKSIIGKKQGISAVFTKMEEVYQRVSNQAVDGDVHGVPIHYKFEYTSTNRLQMIGSHTPQASKWMRNVVLPTHGTIDATYGNTGHTLLMLSVAQNLGVSIQNRSNQTNIDEITAKLNGELADVVNLLKDRINNNEDAVSPKLMAALKSAFGSKFTPSALYALHEYARYLATSDADKKNFNTGLYIEADGVNNGPAAALIMLGGAVELTRKFFTNAARVGYFIGSADRTLNQQRQEDSTGLYEAGAQVLPTFLKTFRDNAAGFVIPEGEFTPAIKLDEYFDHVSLMVSSLLPNFSMDEDGNYAIGRSVIKNPLTKTVYGSGSRGMGNGLLKDMLEALYEKLSIVKLYEDSGMSLDQSFVAVFGEQYQDLFDSMDQLARHNVEIERGQFVVKNVIIPDHLFQNENYLKFEVSGAAFTSMSNNINTFFSKQVKDAITDVMSPAVMDSAQLLARATSFRTEFMAYEFNKLYKAALAKRKNSDHLYRQADGLSNDELRAITNKLSKIFPYIKTTTQSFNPVGRSKVSNDNFIGVTSTQYKVTPSVFIPESAGVSGVPYMIIGLGDGRTIQIFSDGGPEDTLNIYDGIHMGLGKAEEYSKRANSAVWDAWQQGNPFGALFPSLSSFVSNYDWTSFVAAYKSEPEKIKPILAALRVKSIIGLPEHIANLLNNVSTSAKNIDATHQVLGEYKATIDQLASIGSPYVKPGADIVIDDASIAEINSKISSIVRASTNYPVSGIVEGIAVKFNVPVPTKPVKYDLKSFIKKGGAANKTATIQSLMLTGLLNNVSVEYGPLSSFGGKLTRDDYGGYDPKSNTIYIVSDKSGAGIETLTHEMIHAATFRAIANHYADPSNSAIANEVARLEALMESFLNRAALSKDETVRDIFVKISGINNRSVKLNEFMAYGLSNPAMRADLASVNALKLSENIIDKYVGKIKQLIERILEIFGVKAQRTQYDQLVFNTVYVMAGGNDTAISNGQVLKMSISGLGTNDRLSKVTDFFVSSLAKHIKDQLDPAFANLPPKALHTKNPGEFTRASRLGLQVASLISSKFNATPQEQVALNMIVQTLATGAQMDGNIMSGIEELYTHFTKNLTVEDFLLVEPSAATQADTYEANEMYNLVMGNYTTAKDVYGRGQTLPIFFALGLVNDRFRAVLAKKGLPDALKIASTDTDTFLTSSANVLLSKMDKALTGTSKSTNTQQALDSIFSVLVQNGTDSLTLVGAGLNKTGSVVDGLNDRVVSAIEYVSTKLDDGADKVLAASPNKAVQVVGNVTKNIALAMNENTAARVGEFAVSLSNQSNLFKPLQSLIADFVGRTDSNKLPYDMIKFVRSSVQQDRQHYREELPSVLAAQFTRKLSDTEWTHLFTGLAKTDLAQLVDLIGIKETVALLSDPTKIDTRITTLEANLRNQVPNSWPKLQKKAKQLANYMMTGEYGPMLMRNADILQLNFGGNRDEIDSLVTLYALQKLEQPVKDTLLSLVQTQKTGIDTLVSYLSGQRKDDIHPNAAVRLNVYKGYIPSLQNESVSLRIVSDTEHAAMLEKGYIRTGTYAGSIIEPRASSSYYFLNAPARAAFSQGLIQNVHNTSGGIDTRTMFSTGLVAGRITDPRLVNKLAPYLNSDVAGNENLLPIFDETGAIVALERGARPDQLVQLKQNTHLAKMIGVWRGRQVEEHKARAINAALVPRFKQMYSDDLAKNPATAREYINLFDSKDPIHKDALKLMPVYMRKALESEFGKDTFMVRKDMVDSAIGYRTPSVGDAWTGVSGWSPESLEMAKRVTMTVFGNKSYEYLVNAEQMLKNAIQDVKLIIVVKSVIVPVGNMLSNVIQLMARGVPIKDIVRNIPKKISEVTFYTKQRLRKIELEVALRAAEGNNDVVGIRKAKNELETIEDSFRRLSIWPLINAGEFSAISDVGIARDDIVLSEGRLHTYMENLVDKLPEGVRTAAKYGLVAKDTALFQGLQKAVEYGDFLAKAIEYDYLIGSKKLSKEDSLARISEEFVNYDLLMGRFREYAENIGLVWFTAFKVRSTKIAASIIRNNPFHALMSTLPHSYMPAGTGSPITDNGVAKVLSGDIWYSLGFGQALRAPALNPWVNLAH